MNKNELLEVMQRLQVAIADVVRALASEPLTDEKAEKQPANQATAAAVATPTPTPEPKLTEVKHRQLMEVRALFCQICDKDPASTSWCRNVVEQFGCSKLSELTPEQMDKAYAEAAAWLNIPF